MTRWKPFFLMLLVIDDGSVTATGHMIKSGIVLMAIRGNHFHARFFIASQIYIYLYTSQNSNINDH